MGEGDEVILKKSAATRPARFQRPRADPGHQLVTLGELQLILTGYNISMAAKKSRSLYCHDSSNKI